MRRPGVGMGRRRGFRGIGGGVSEWTPRELAALQRWWRASNGLTGDPVTAWKDVENAVDVEAGNAVARGTLGGQVVPHFDGAADYLQDGGSTADYKYLHDGTGGTIVLVASLDAASGARAAVVTGSGVGTTVGTYLATDGTGSVIWIIGNGTATVISIDSTSTPFATPGAHVISAAYGTGQTLDAVLRIDGTEDATMDQTAAPSTGNATNVLTVGARAAGASRWWDGPIAEVLFFNAILSAEDLARVEDFLMGIYL